ncbi:MAG: ABC transporter permease [Taibaiella sp.]|nr:ABC transporter permease [Taibaiella sp.]
MFKEIFLFEFKYGLKRPATYLFAAFLFSLSLLLAMAATGVFNLPQSDSLTTINSAHSVADYLISTNANALGLLNSIILISLIATAVQKDYQYGIHPLFFTKPISKGAYFFGRFLGAFSIAVLVFSFSITGLFLGCLAGYGHPNLGPFHIWNFLQPFLIFVVPNIFLQGIIYFSLTTFLRNTLVAYLFAIIILVLQFASGVLISDIDNKTLASLLEISGERAFIQVTEYWTPAQKNTLMLPFKNEILYNRLIWIGVALAVTGISFWKFRFSQFLQPLGLFKKTEKESVLILNKYESLADIPKVNIVHNLGNKIKRTLFLSWYELRKIVNSSFYIIICVLGLAITIIAVILSGNWQDEKTYPVTYTIIELIRGGFQFVLIIFIIFYSGTVIWKEKETKTDELIGVTPISNTSLFFSKFMGVVSAVLIILLISCLTGITIQLSEGFWDFSPNQYIVYILESTVIYGINIMLCMAIQSIFSNKYIGFFVSLVPILFLPIVLSVLKIENPILYFNNAGNSLPYSDMNGYGGKHFVWGIYKVYWLSFTLFLSVLGILVYYRGKEKGVFKRWRLNRSSSSSLKYISLFVLLGITAGTGYYIYSQNKIMNAGINSSKSELLEVKYEKEYKYLEQVPQPRVISVNAKIDIFPSKKAFDATVDFILKNKTKVPIDTLVVLYNGKGAPQFHYTILQPNRNFDLVKDDAEIGIRILKLHQAILPGDSIHFQMQLDYRQVGAFSNQESSIVENGTFFNNMYFISFGYDPSQELSSNIARKKHGLEEKQRTAPLEDTLARYNNYISNDADWLDFEATISTSSDQTAIAPGYLQKKWSEHDRNYFHYKMDSPILNFYAFQSARYEIRRSRWNDVNIEIYYHKGHEYNIEKMIESIKESLSYYTTHFGPYQHRQVRIIEFPRYRGFAQSFPNTIPYSEEIGFITRSEEGKDRIDMPFYVTAHEVAHQWWAHQVIGGKLQGSEMLSESMSQYSALMVMEKKYGRKAMKKFLKHELNDYLRRRTFENKKELPISRVEHQGYIYYSKGSLVLYALRDYLGEETLNSAIRTFLNKTRFQEPPYTTSTELIEEIRKVTPDSLQYLVTDLFDKITLYEKLCQRPQI